MAPAIEKVYRDRIEFNECIPHREYAGHCEDVEEYVRGIGWPIDRDDKGMTFELRMPTEWEIRDLLAEMENELGSKGISYTARQECMREDNILRLEYRVPEEAGPAHATDVAEHLGRALEQKGVDRERVSWQVP